jgi:hypothetical protein
MKPRLILFYTHDRNFDRVLSKALFGTDAIVFTARSAGGARGCLNKPVHAARLANAIADLNAPHHQPVAA